MSAAHGDGRDGALLEVDDLRVHFATPRGTVRAVDGVSFVLGPGETLGIVGESGSGKTVVCRSVMGLPLGSNATVSGAVRLAGTNISALPMRARRALWGNEIAVVLQDPMTSLNPVMRIGRQVTEVLRLHRGLSKPAARRQALELLDDVGIADPERRIDQYPHELSGGMQQRVTIAIALACDPKLLLADEPTTALDVTVQAQILELLHGLQRERSMAMILVSHDLGVVAGYADKVAVMYSGKVVEAAPTATLLAEPQMPYTAALMASVPRVEHPPHSRLAAIGGRPPHPTGRPEGCSFAPRCRWTDERCLNDEPRLTELPGRADHLIACWHPLAATSSPAVGFPLADRRAAGSVPLETPRAPDTPPLLELDDVIVTYPARHGHTVSAVAGVSLAVRRRETLGLVGESGCGKSSIANAIVQLPPPSGGRVLFAGQDLGVLSTEELRRVRCDIQQVFQDPVGALNPRRRVRDLVAEPLAIWGRDHDADRIAELLDDVGLDVQAIGDRRPHELSGGQCQRVAIARALALAPQMLICDEPVSSLDVSVQAQILNLLEDLKDRYGLTMIFIAHDLAVVKAISDRVAVMYLGKLCELGPADEIYRTPRHPYTAALIAAIPPLEVGRRLAPEELLPGTVPSPLSPPSGCRFRTRCSRASERCASEEPVMRIVGAGRSVACHHPLEHDVGAVPVALGSRPTQIAG